jgi:hypothetical protein
MAGIEAWGGLISSGIGLAAAIVNKPYHAVQTFDVKQYATKQYKYSTAPVPDNSVAVYNRAYSKMVGRMNALEVMFKGERDITSARLRGVKERMAVGLSQDEAEANIRLNAAAAGVTGGNVEENIYQTHANVGFRLSDQIVSETNNIQKAKSEVYRGKQGSVVAKDDYTVENVFTGGDRLTSSGGTPDFGPAISDKGDYSLAGSIMSSLSVFDNNFFKDLGLALEDIGGNSLDYSIADRDSVRGGMGGL